MANQLCDTAKTGFVDRRSALKMAAAAAGVAGAACSSGIAPLVGSACRPAMAIEPIERSKPNFKYSLAAYSYRKLLTAKQNALTLFDFADDCATFGLQGTELTSYYFPQDVEDRYLLDLKHHCFQLGLDVSGTAVGNDFGYAVGDQRRSQIEGVKRWIERAATLGAPVIRIFAGHRHGATADETHRLMVAGIQECCEYAGQYGVFLALENHGGPTATAEGLMQFVRDVDSRWFGVNLDTGNFHSDDIYGELAAVAPYALNVQVKASISGPDRKPKKTDFAKIAAILRDANYRGYVVLEFEDAGDPRMECPRLLGQLRAALEAALDASE